MSAFPLHYRWDGRADGPGLVLSHSLGATLEMWEPQIAALGGRFRLLRYDHRGHGGSAMPGAPWTIADFGRDVISLLDELRLERVHFCGLSLGGIVGLWLGQNAPERVEKLALCNCSAVIENTDLLRGRMGLIAREGLGAIVENVLDRWLTADFRAANPGTADGIRDLILATPADGYLRACEALCTFDLRPGLSSISTPSLAIYGRHDVATPPAWTRAFAEAMPDCRIVELFSAHLSNVEAAAEFNRVLGDFLVA
jgi:3-oxoadipate enol-lactonase